MKQTITYGIAIGIQRIDLSSMDLPITIKVKNADKQLTQINYSQSPNAAEKPLSSNWFIFLTATGNQEYEGILNNATALIINPISGPENAKGIIELEEIKHA